MSGLHSKIDNSNNKLPKNNNVIHRVKIYAMVVWRDFWRTVNTFFKTGRKERMQMLFVPAMIVILVAAVIYLEGANERINEADTHMLRIENPSISLIYDIDKNGDVTSAWLRTPKTSRRIGQIDGLAYIADSKFYSDVDGDGVKDLLWRISFNNDSERAGVHIWIGVLTALAKIYVCSTPYEYTRWDAVPTKIRTPSSCALYVSPGVPGTDFRGRECYSFIYTIKLTTEGPAFVPVPSVYKQLFPILRAAANTEDTEELHRAYIDMLTEFRNLSEGKAPSVEMLTELKIDNVDLIPLK